MGGIGRYYDPDRESYCRDIRRSQCQQKLKKKPQNVQSAKGESFMDKWINYHSEKPNKNGYYLCYHMTSKCGNNQKWKREILYWKDNVWLYDANCFKIADFVNYWMPLPEPPHAVMEDIRRYYDSNNE